ncbi:MAG: iron-siderophore ABC transporter substrate-binding protein [Kamptonema sp. SIO4C4]|nr:iron-siderophore ABC transporter substrate-binding protein [Kamptonema sp. SIO4C4]
MLGLAFCTAIMVTACEGLSPNSQQQYTSSNVDPTQLTRTVQHAMGETQVPATPKRVVALGPFILESLVAIDAPMVGAPIEREFPGLKQQAKDTHDISYPPNLERIVALKPDLIIGSTVWKDIYVQASQIAPTVLFEIQRSGQWQEIFQSVGRAMNQPEAVQAVLTQYNQRLEKLRQRLEKPAKTIEVSLVRIFPDRVNLVTAGSFSGTILEDAQLSRPPSQQGDDVYRTISREQLHLADGDVLFVWSRGNSPEEREKAQASIEQLKTDPLWSQLEVVQEDKVYKVNGNYWIGTGPVAANFVIDDLFRYLVEEESS